MKRILIVGSGGAGNSTLARVIHLDELCWKVFRAINSDFPQLSKQHGGIGHRHLP
jgi:adenylate kinase family enzyme